MDRWREGMVWPDHLALNDRANHLFVTDNGYVHVFDSDAGRTVRTVSLRVGGSFDQAGVDARAGRFYAVTDSCIAVTLDAATGRLIGKYPVCSGGRDGWLAVDDRRHSVYLWSTP